MSFMDTGPTLGKEEGVRSGFGVKKIVRWLASLEGRVVD